MHKRCFLAALVAAVAVVCPADATLTSTSNTVTYTGNAVTTSFTVPFKFLASTDLVVTVAGATKTLNSDYTVTGAGNATGTVKFTVAPANAASVVITRVVPFTQTASVRTALPFPAGATIDTALDKLTMLTQQAVPLGGTANLSSLALTAPLPMTSGGTGVANLNCGAGVVTGNGTNLLCTALSGLAPPGTTGILLQSAFPGSPQVGHMSITGSFGSAANPGGGGGYFLPTSSAPGGLSLRPWSYNSGNTGQGAVFSIYGGFNAVAAYQFQWNGGFSNSGYVNLIMNGCGSGGANPAPCISTNSSGPGTPLYLAGLTTNSANNAVYVDTTLNRTVAGTVFGVRNNSLDKFTVDINGAVVAASTVTSTGLTSSGPVSGTTGSFSSTLTVTGTTTHTGSVAMNGGATIGASGTAISGSFRAAAAMANGSIAAQSCYTQTITVTGAALGGECVTGSLSQAWNNSVTITCFVPSANNCVIQLCNPTAGAINPGSPTIGCRVFNP